MIQDNWTAESNPTSADNASAGYERGSKWFNLLTGQFFVCSAASIGDATWVGATATEPAPIASFTFEPDPATGEAPLEVVFTNTSQYGYTYAWEKSDDGENWVPFEGEPTAESPTEDFAAGTWSVRVMVTNNSGGDTSTQSDIVVATAP